MKRINIIPLPTAYFHDRRINESDNMDIIITLPKGTSWEEYKKEINAVADGSEVMNFKVTNFPTKTSVGSKCYLVYDGRIMGYMLISGLSEKSFTCSTTGRQWSGKFIERSGKFHDIEPIKMAGFRGFRYFNLEEYKAQNP